MAYRWSKDTIVNEILALHSSGVDLSYSNIAEKYVALLRAATRYYGSWNSAVNEAGIPYSGIRKYRQWTRESVIEGIQQMHAEGHDLSWKYVSTIGNPQLAAAATKVQKFGSWRAALEAAGIEYKVVRRYKSWTEEAIVERILELEAQGIGLNAKNIEDQEMTLITAARRRFKRWDFALKAAGLNPQAISLRRHKLPIADE